MQSSVVTVKGQIVIPAPIRKKVGLKKGTRVFIEEKNGDIVVHPATDNFYDRCLGMFKGSGLLKLLESERRNEKKREDLRLGKK